MANFDPEKDPYSLLLIGGFHKLMSFLGGIEFIMDGSGLKEALNEIYAERSTEKLLTGRIYSRVIRGHFLVQLVLTEIFLSSFKLTDTEEAKLNGLLLTLGKENIRIGLEKDEFTSIRKNHQPLETIQNS